MTCEAALPNSLHFPYFGRFRRDAPLEALLGGTVVEPILLPVDLTAASPIDDRLENYHDVGTCLRKAIECCTLMENQSNRMKNTYTLRFLLLYHLIVKVIPLPLPLHSGERLSKCFWSKGELRRETQMDLLRLLVLVSRHFLVASFSLRMTRALDAMRVTTMACLCCLADAIVRRVACDCPSTLSLHYSGEAEGPVQPFGFDILYFADECEFMLCPDPHLHTARVQVLDYFSDIRDSMSSDHLIFEWESSMELSVGDSALLSQIVTQWGFNPNPALLPYYMTGEKSDIGELTPELFWFRDLVFAFKALMNPKADNIPELRRWEVHESRLVWSVNTKSRKVEVKSFGKTLEGVAFVKDDYYDMQKKKKGVFNKWFKWLGIGGKTRAPPSAADPSNLVPGQKIENEEDVLHLKSMPDFDGRLRASDCEHLLQYLTAPYLRIPLILQFFADENRVEALASPSLLNVVEAALFEPSLWQRVRCKALPEMIPSPTREVLATPAGLLFNELTHCPRIIASALVHLLCIALEKDTGRYQSQAAQLLMCVTRLCVGVEEYLLVLLRHHKYWNNDKHRHTRNKKDTSLSSINETESTPPTTTTTPPPLYSHCGYSSLARGLDCSNEVVRQLADCQKKIRALLMGRVLKLFEEFALKAVSVTDIPSACVFHAHIALICKIYEYENYTKRIVSSLLGSLVFIFTHHGFSIDVHQSEEISHFKTNRVSQPHVSKEYLNNNYNIRNKKYLIDDNKDNINENKNNNTNEGGGGVISGEDGWIPECLGVSELEVFEILQTHRKNILRWMTNNSSDANHVLEHVVRNSSFTAIRGEGKQPVSLTGRSWHPLASYGGVGRYVPDTDVISPHSKNIHTTTASGGVVSNGGHTTNNITTTNITKNSSKHDKSSKHTQKHTNKSTTDAVSKDALTYESWLRNALRNDAEVEVSVQTGEFSLRKNAIEVLGDWVMEFPDFRALFGDQQRNKMQSALVSASTNRYWCRIMGRRHDLIRWESDSTLHSPFPSNKKYSPTTLTVDQRWIPAVLDSWVNDHLRPYSKKTNTNIELFIDTYINKSTVNYVARLWWIQKAGNPDDETSTDDIHTHPHCLKEIIVTRDPPSVELYDVVEHGRRFYPLLSYVSDSSCSNHSVSEKFLQVNQAAGGVVQLAGGGPLGHCIKACPSLVITRTLTKELGPQTFMPSRFFNGILPTALLEAYEFWQNEKDDSFSGYQRKESREASRVPTELRIYLLKDSNHKHDATAVVQRFVVKPKNICIKNNNKNINKNINKNNKQITDETQNEEIETHTHKQKQKQTTVKTTSIYDPTIMEPDTSMPTLFLVNTRYTSPGSYLNQFIHTLRRLDQLSHVIVWSRSPVVPPPLEPSIPSKCPVNIDNTHTHTHTHT
eukprot:GHVR01024575.1.p1 GENE.GHVR01024575.1~~GHVR01024575.1.p1  ORF type:complete len:1627 (+),score=452.86 GHVR01024575.1:727-4881(+)